MGIIRESGKRSQEKISPKSVNYLNVLVFGKKSDGFSFVYFSQCLIFFLIFSCICAMIENRNENVFVALCRRRIFVQKKIGGYKL